MKKFSVIFLLLISSCVHCMQPSEYDRNVAQSYYDSFGSYLVSDNKTRERLKKKFICYYRIGDKFYSYTTFFGTKYVLVRGHVAITYIEE